MDPWQIILALAAVVAGMAAAYSRLVAVVNAAAEKREERAHKQTELLMTLVQNNTKALDSVCAQGSVHSGALEEHDQRAAQIGAEVHEINTHVRDIKTYLQEPENAKRAGMG